MAAEPDPPTQLPRATTQPDEPPHLVRISRKVFAAELREIVASRERRFAKEQAGDEAPKRELERVRNLGGPTVVPTSCGLVGLALSGGGIRSATFCLGVLQRLAEAGFLRFVDYLSTVSGGGYTGSAWTALLTKSKCRTVESPPDFPFAHVQANGGKQVLENRSAADNEEPAALLHVRDFANYLVPSGLRDYATAPILLLRGLIINGIVMMPYLLLAAALTIAWISVIYGAGSFSLQDQAAGDGGRTAFSLKLVLTPILFAFCLAYLLLMTVAQATLRSLGRAESWQWRSRWLGIGTFLFALLLVAVIFELQPLAVYFLARPESGNPFFSDRDFWSGLTVAAGGIAGVVAGMLGASPDSLKRRVAFLLAGLLGPVALWVAYLYLCRLAVHPPAFSDTTTSLVVWLSERPEWLQALLGWLITLFQLTGTTTAWLSDFGLAVSNRGILPDPQVAEWAVAYVLLAALVYIWSMLAIDVNTTSLHNYYRDRLGRAFMIGAERNDGAGRWGIRHHDQIDLAAIKPGKSGGPYHLINTTANSPDFSRSGRIGNLAQRGRRAEFFLLSPCFCGNERLGYCASAELKRADPHLDLATAMAISGAAAAPNMGQKSLNPLLTFLMGMLNIRLGYWLPKPKSVSERHWFRLSVGPLYFIAELIGIPPSGDRAYINLSDGGHLENLGVFELLRRRCRYIIAIDAEADPTMTFNGLATLQRLAKIDLGVEIHFDVEDLRHQSSKLSRRHFTLARIEYGDGDWGELLYIKSSLTGTEIEYIKEYVSRHQDFPHESTGDQFFDEAQFEAYRALGYKIGNELMADGKNDADEGIEAFFRRWREVLRPAAPFPEAFLALPDKRLELDLRLHEEERIRYLDEIYPNLLPAHASFPANGASLMAHIIRAVLEGGPKQEKGADVHLLQLVNEQMQLMEQTVLSLHLNERTNQNHPRNRGWINLFRRWAKSPIFRKYWAVSIANYSDVLLIFCKYALDLKLRVGWSRHGGPTEAEEALFQPSTLQQQRVQRWYGYVLPSPEVADNGTALIAAPRAAEGQDELGTCVAVALVEDGGVNPILRGFRIRKPYRNLRLSERLLRALLEAVAQPDRDLLYCFGEYEETEDSQRLKRVMSRIDHLHPYQAGLSVTGNHRAHHHV